MSAGFTILVSILIIVVLGLSGVIAFFLTKEEEEKEDKPHFESFIKQGEGRAYGKILKIESAVEGRKIITYRPQDLSVKTLKKIKKLEPVSVIVDKNKLLCFPKGTLSNEKDIYWGLPKNVDDFPENFGKTLLGKWLMLLTELKNFDNTEIQAYKERVERQTDHIKDIGMGEATR